MSDRSVRVEKRKWDGSLAASEVAELVETSATAIVWLVPSGTERQRPRAGSVEVTDRDELWVAVEGEWWVLGAEVGADRTIEELVVHAAAPVGPVQDGLILWVDLDLDFEVQGDEVSLEDEAEFHAHARIMSYPDDVVHGAWSGISGIAARYTTGDWPFDGFLERCLA